MPVERVIGVWDDGSDPSADVPSNPRTLVRIVQGSTWILKMRVLYVSGERVNLPARVTADNLQLFMAVKKQTTPAGFPADLEVAGAVMPAEGVERVDFAVTPDQTRFLAAGLYVYDVWAVTDTEREPLIPTSRLHLEPSVYLP